MDRSEDKGSFICTLFGDRRITWLGVLAMNVRREGGEGGSNEKKVEHGFWKGKRGSQGDGIGSKRVGMTDIKSQGKLRDSARYHGCDVNRIWSCWFHSSFFLANY